MPPFPDTIVALSTPVGTSALAVVRASGVDTTRLAAELFGACPPPRSVRRADYRDASGNLIDDVLFVFFRAPHSYTAEDTLEISCHGNPFIAQKIVEDLLQRGCRMAGPGEFTQRAFLNGQIDLSQAEAVMDLIHARSDRALAVANQQLRGSLGRRAAAAVDHLLSVIARVEAYIDFPEEDLPPEDRQIVANGIRAAAGEANKILATNHYGEILRAGLKTVIVGQPNVGKSSLLNCLVGRERALVSPEPGTTRDYLEEQIIVGPHAIRLIDTAGLNDSPAPLERLGMSKTWEQLAEADLALIVLDGSAPPPESLPKIQEAAPAGRALVVFNKLDLRRGDSSTSPYPAIPGAVWVSAKTGEGISELRERIADFADSFAPTTGDDVIAINARHAMALKRVGASLASALRSLENSVATELLASDLREALHAWEEIAGRIDNERMLDHLFASFCIGK